MSDYRVLRRRVPDEWAGPTPPPEAFDLDHPPEHWARLATEALRLADVFTAEQQAAVAVAHRLDREKRGAEAARHFQRMVHHGYDFRNAFGRAAWPLMQKALAAGVPADALYQFLRGWPQGLDAAEAGRRFEAVVADLRTLRDRLGPVASSPTPEPRAQDGRTFAPAQLAELAGCSNDTVGKYAKLAGVQTPSRGKRDHRYTAADARGILEQMIAAAPSTKAAERYRAALESLK